MRTKLIFIGPKHENLQLRMMGEIFDLKENSSIHQRQVEGRYIDIDSIRVLLSLLNELGLNRASI